jgi:hypothetical protein
MRTVLTCGVLLFSREVILEEFFAHIVQLHQITITLRPQEVMI